MKKMIVILVAALLVVAGYSASEAASVNSTVPLSFTVGDEFGFTLSKYAHDFGSILTGGGAETTITMFCKSNHGRKWLAGIQAPEFSNGTGGVLASDPGFIMAGWSDEDGAGKAEGTWLYKTGPVPSALMYDFYESSIAEGSDPFTVLTLGLYITVPAGQASGLYATNMVLTMHD